MTTKNKQQQHTPTPCCEHDHNKDGNCDRHPEGRPRVFDDEKQQRQAEIKHLTESRKALLEACKKLASRLDGSPRNMTYQITDPELVSIADAAIALAEEKP
jgi:hypothetical protein